jgi:hypothetical protein
LILTKRSVFIGAALVGLGLAASGGCSSGDPVPTEEAKRAEMKYMAEEQTRANDAAGKAARQAQARSSKVGVMPP